MDPISIALGLAQFAPTILRFLGAGDSSVKVAEQVGGIAKVVSGAHTPEEALQVIQQNQAMQVQFQQAVLQNDTELEKAFLADRADARKRDVAFINAGIQNRRGDILAYGAIGALISLVFLLFFKASELPNSVRDLLLILSGALVAIVKDVYGFEFGSTKSSKDKDTVIATLTRKE